MNCPKCNKDIQPETVNAFYFDVMKWQCTACRILIVKSEMSYPKCVIEIKKELALLKRRIDNANGVYKSDNEIERGCTNAN